MAIATGSGHSLGAIAEVTYGTTPATPVFVNVRHTDCSLGMDKSSSESDELRSDRQIAHFRHGNKTVGGAIPFKMSYGSHDQLLEAVLCGTWSANVLKAGSTRRSFTFERKFADLTVPEYHRFTGSEITSMSLSIAPDAIVSGTFNIVSQGADTPATSIITGATYGAATVTQPFDSFTGVINEGGSPIGVVTALEFTVDNGITPIFVVGSSETVQPGIRKSRVTGTLTAYFESSAMLNKFYSETASSIDLTLTDGTSSLLIDLPNVKYNGAKPDTSGEGEITIALPFIALYSTGDASQIVLTRTP